VSAEPAGVGRNSRLTANHPDLDWLRGWREDLDRYLRLPARTPTSSVTGDGAVAAAEALLSGCYGGRAVLLLPSGTHGLQVALRVLGVGPGAEVLVPALDWPSAHAAVRALGARPVPVGVEEDTLTIDPSAAAARRTARTLAVVATHLLGTPADVPALRAALPGVPVVEDCAQTAPGDRLDGLPLGTLGDLAVASFGPGKVIDCDEGGALVAATVALWRRALALAGHPVRLELAGLTPHPWNGLSGRPHPLAAVRLCVRLQDWPSVGGHARAEAAATRRVLASTPGVAVLGRGARQLSGVPGVPVLLAGEDRVLPPGYAGGAFGGRVLPDTPARLARRLKALQRRIRVVRPSP
jgi:dTDP-4-amino-4,6-dideoxygalactose transaminase